MRFLAVGVSIALVGGAAVWAQAARAAEQDAGATERGAPATAQVGGTVQPSAAGAIESAGAIERGARWLASVQGRDGGWGQDGGGASPSRPGERIESSGNDIANTAVAALALLKAGPQYAANVDRALDFILRRVESSPTDGLAITDPQGTQIQRKLGPYIDTFLTSMLLVQVDGRLTNAASNARVRQALQKTIAKIEAHQLADGSWNYAGGWAPVLGTSMASRSLFAARQQGVRVDGVVLDRAENYTVSALDAAPAAASPAILAGSAGGIGTGAGAGGGIGTGLDVSSARTADADAAGVTLYRSAQALEQLSRTPEDREVHAARIAGIQSQLANQVVVNGFGSMGGEEFFSYLNIGDSLKRVGGDAWSQWHARITTRILALQNADGTWAGHHCITGRVAMTSAAILNLTIDRAD